MVTDANANGNEAGHRALAERRGEETESTIGELHGLMANITVALGRAHLWGGSRQFRAQGKSRPGNDHRQKTPRTRLMALRLEVRTQNELTLETPSLETTVCLSDLIE